MVGITLLLQHGFVSPLTAFMSGGFPRRFHRRLFRSINLPARLVHSTPLPLPLITFKTRVTTRFSAQLARCPVCPALTWLDPGLPPAQLRTMSATTSEIGSIIGIGASCFASVYINQTVFKGYEIWVDGRRRSYTGRPCEEALRREASVYQQLGKHPRILDCYGLVESHPGVHSLHLELAPLGNVRQYIDDHSLPPSRTRISMALDTAVGLAHVHARGVRHADLSCRNLFLFNGFRVKIGDFGASVVEGSNFTPEVCEEARYELPCRSRSFDDWPMINRELFALGSSVYEIVAWERPFPSLKEEEVEERYAREEFPSLDIISAVRPTITNCWKEVYKTADDAVASLDEVLAVLPEEDG